jgi:hypothetical protein
MGFTEPLTTITTGVIDPGLLIWSPGSNAWTPVLLYGNTSLNALHNQAVNGATDGTLAVQLIAPTDITYTPPLNLSVPVTAIPPPSPTPARPYRATFFSGSQYTVDFTSAVTLLASGSTDPAFLAWSPGSNAWTTMVTASQPGPNSIRFTNTLGASDITHIVMVANPTYLSSGTGFAPSTPVTAIT